MNDSIEHVNPYLEPHPLANLFPMMTADEFKKLKESIAKHGLDEPIVTYEGKILDGRNRYKACQELGVRCFHGEYVADEVSPADYVILKNRDRRHLSASQLSTVGRKLKEYYAAEARERHKELSGRPSKDKPPEKLPEVSKGDARDAAGKAVGVSGKLIDFADKVAKKGTPALNAAVESDQIKVSKAAKIADLPPAEQDKIVSGEAEFKPPKPKPKKATPEPVEEASEPKKSSTFSVFRDRLEALIEGLGDIEPHQWHIVGDMLTDAGEAAYAKAKSP